MPHTPFGYLLHEALVQGSTSFNESGVRFSLSRRPNETILVFRTDDNQKRSKDKNSGATESFRSSFGIQKDDYCSDMLLLYVREDQRQENTVRLLLIELKGNDHGHAVEQLERTLVAVKGRLSHLLGENLFKPPTLGALILSNKSSPHSFAKKQGAFYKKWKFAPQLCRPHEDEIRNHLR